MSEKHMHMFGIHGVCGSRMERCGYCLRVYCDHCAHVSHKRAECMEERAFQPDGISPAARIAALEYDAETARLIEEHKMHIEEPREGRGGKWFAGFAGVQNWNVAPTLGEAVRAAVKAGGGE